MSLRPLLAPQAVNAAALSASLAALSAAVGSVDVAAVNETLEGLQADLAAIPFNSFTPEVATLQVGPAR